MTRILPVLLALAAAALPLSASADSRYRYDDRYDDRYGGSALVNCSSRDERPRYCNVDTRGGVRLVRQESRAPCIQGRTWGHDRRGIWVSHGCRARFETGRGLAWGSPGYGYGAPGYGYGSPGYGDGYGYGHGGQIVRCESHDERQRFCRVRGGLRDVQIVRRLSDTRCRYNYNWGFRRDGIWVDNGCRAEFRVN